MKQIYRRLIKSSSIRSTCLGGAYTDEILLLNVAMTSIITLHRHYGTYDRLLRRCMTSATSTTTSIRCAVTGQPAVGCCETFVVLLKYARRETIICHDLSSRLCWPLGEELSIDGVRSVFKIFAKDTVRKRIPGIDWILVCQISRIFVFRSMN